MPARTHEHQIVERSERRAPQVDMTPMIDCVFLLIIFFMLATTFAPLPGMRVKLPPTSPGPMQAPRSRCASPIPWLGRRRASWC